MEMKKINRIMTNICSDKLAESRDFYTKLFNLNVAYDSDWFVHLISNNKKLELGIIDRTSEIVPKDFQKSPEGFYVTFVVDNADEVFKIAKFEKFEIINEPHDTFYGQRRLLLKDPNGALVDVSSPIENFEF
jgi:catechol 2,3-dioxygenase-like lactoylglutathione lyase family enzyme